MKPLLLVLAVMVILTWEGSLISARGSATFVDQAQVTDNTLATDTLSPPTALSASGSGPISLTWSATTDTYASGYRIFRAGSSAGPYTQIAVETPRSDTSYPDDACPGTHFYMARSYYQNWESVNSNTTSATVPGAAIPAISFRSAASGSAPAGATSLTISRPTGTAAGEVMVAAIAVRPETATLTPPSAWTLVRRMDNANANANSLAVYYKAAGGSEPASYSWTVSSSSTGSVGGIQTFRDVNTADPINVDNGQNTANSTTHTAPSVTTSLDNTMLVMAHAFTSAATWTPPASTTEAFDRASEIVPNTGGISIEGSYDFMGTAGSTGTKTATASNDADVGNAHILALTPRSPINFRAAASNSVSSGSLTISRPSGTTNCDVMIASIGVRPETVSITAPSGWTLVRRTDNAAANANSLAVYYKVAGGSEPASYTWTVSGSSTGSAGGIQTFSGVDTSDPIDVENGQTTGNSTSHSTPGVTTVANTMLVTAHTFTSAATWTAPAGMNEAFDQASVATPSSGGQSIVGSYQFKASAGATGAKTATAANDADVGNAHILALNPAP